MSAPDDPAMDLTDDDLLGMLRDDASHWAAVPDIPGVQGLVEIAAGGQGRVYRGRRLGDERTVAVKVLHPAAAGDDVARRRFEREVELLAELDHPGIVPVLGHGFAGDRPYLVMALVDGRPLQRVAADASVDRRRRTLILERLADAIAHAHGRGVLHRDLSPANVLVGADDQVTVLDFGLARAVDPGSIRTAISVTGDFVGSVAWAAPEQFRGEPAAADVRTDVHAIGGIGHLLLTGHGPYEADGGLPAVVRAITEGPGPDPRRVAPDLDEDLVAILERCLARDPADRYDAAADVRDDLRRVRHGEPIAARQSGAWRRAQRSLVRSRRLLAGAAAVVVFSAVIAGGAVVLADRASDAERETSAALSESRRQTNRMQQTLGVLVEALGAVDPGNAGGDAAGPITAVDVLDTVERRLQGGGLPRDVRSELMIELARIRNNRGEYEAAERLADAAYALIDAADPGRRGDVLSQRGVARHGLDRGGEAAEDLMAAAELHERASDSRDTRSQWSHWFEAEASRVHAAAAMGSAGEYAEMQSVLEGVIDRTDGEPPPMPSIAAIAHRRLAELWSYRGSSRPAIDHAERALELLRLAGQEDSFEAADVARLLAAVALVDGRWEDARRMAARAAATHLALMDPPHPLGAVAIAMEAQALARLGDPDVAMARCDEAERLRLVVTPDASNLSAELLARRAEVLHVVGRETEALETWAMARARDSRMTEAPGWTVPHRQPARTDVPGP